MQQPWYDVSACDVRGARRSPLAVRGRMSWARVMGACHGRDQQVQQESKDLLVPLEPQDKKDLLVPLEPQGMQVLLVRLAQQVTLDPLVQPVNKDQLV